MGEDAGSGIEDLAVGWALGVELIGELLVIGKLADGLVLCNGDQWERQKG